MSWNGPGAMASLTCSILVRCRPGLAANRPDVVVLAAGEGGPGCLATAPTPLDFLPKI